MLALDLFVLTEALRSLITDNPILGEMPIGETAGESADMSDSLRLVLTLARGEEAAEPETSRETHTPSELVYDGIRLTLGAWL